VRDRRGRYDAPRTECNSYSTFNTHVRFSPRQPPACTLTANHVAGDVCQREKTSRLICSTWCAVSVFRTLLVLFDEGGMLKADATACG